MKKYSLLYSLVLLGLIAGKAMADPLLEKGHYLSQAGDCSACHTAPGGKPFAGGLPMTTPIGAIYSSNITPDKETGIEEYNY
ncbi:MAG: Gluconate 2-dehydrogenase cytochrome c subunit [Candidatus Erwinia impunctatus]|nr:Gluconate 2-dehydrogenase cytochrome c subunit [Culicoides impunctatus]